MADETASSTACPLPRSLAAPSRHPGHCPGASRLGRVVCRSRVLAGNGHGAQSLVAPVSPEAAGLAVPFVLGVALVNALQPAARASWLLVLIRSALCLATVVLVSNTTSFSEILRVLRRVRVPALLITTMALMHRYLFVLADETERMQRARASRTFVRGRRARWQTLATVVGQLFVRASERAERIYAAMCARGWK